MKRYLLAVILSASATLPAVEYTFAKIADNAAGSPFRDFKPSVAINDNGTVAFAGITEIVGRDPVRQGIYSSSGGAVTTIADTNGNLADFVVGGINLAGRVAFLAMDRTFNYGIYTGEGGPLNTVALNSSETPVRPLHPPDINNEGAVTYQTDSRIFVRQGSATRTALDARTGPYADLIVNSAQWNSRGDLAFVLYSSVNSTVGKGGLFYERAGQITAISRDNGPVTHQVISGGGAASMNANGVGAFLAFTNVFPPQLGVFTATAGGRVATVEAGDKNGSVGGMVCINDQGTVAYSLLGDGGSPTGIVTGPDRANDKVIVAGDTLFGERVARVVPGNFAGGRFLNNKGQIAFLYILQSGVVGLAVATPKDSGPVSGKPSVAEGGIVNAASLAPQAAPAPGTIVSLFGTNLAPKLTVASTPILPTSLDGVSVTFNGIAAPLFFVSPGQVNAQVPFELTGASVNVVVRTAQGESEPRRLTLASLNPAIYTMDQSGKGQGVVVLANSAIIAAPAGAYAGSRPAKRGETITIYANGLGAVTPTIENGVNSCGGTCAPNGSNLVLRYAVTPPNIFLGGMQVPQANVLFAGLTPEFAGLYQINVTIPLDAKTGPAVPVLIRQGTVVFSRDDVTIAIE